MEKDYQNIINNFYEIITKQHESECELKECETKIDSLKNEIELIRFKQNKYNENLNKIKIKQEEIRKQLMNLKYNSTKMETIYYEELNKNYEKLKNIDISINYNLFPIQIEEEFYVKFIGMLEKQKEIIENLMNDGNNK